MNILDWFHLETNFIDQFDLLCSPTDSQESSPAPQFEDISSLVLDFFMALTSVRDYWKNNSFNYGNFVGKMMSLFFNMLSRFARAFLWRSNCLLISWLQWSLQWLWSPREQNPWLLQIPPLLFAIKCWNQMPCS